MDIDDRLTTLFAVLHAICFLEDKSNAQYGNIGKDFEIPQSKVIDTRLLGILYPYAYKFYR